MQLSPKRLNFCFFFFLLFIQQPKTQLPSRDMKEEKRREWEKKLFSLFLCKKFWRVRNKDIFGLFIVEYKKLIVSSLCCKFYEQQIKINWKTYFDIKA